MVTKDWLERLRAERKTPQYNAPEPAFGLDGDIRRESNAYGEFLREQCITNGEIKMRLALVQLRRERAEAVLEGYSQSRFNHHAGIKQEPGL